MEESNEISTGSISRSAMPDNYSMTTKVQVPGTLEGKALQITLQICGSQLIIVSTGILTKHFTDAKPILIEVLTCYRIEFPVMRVF